MLFVHHNVTITRSEVNPSSLGNKSPPREEDKKFTKKNSERTCPGQQPELLPASSNPHQHLPICLIPGAKNARCFREEKWPVIQLLIIRNK